MSELLTFARLGYLHITDLQGADHILFLLVLAAVYRLREWKEALWVMSAFTVGHSITLALAVTGLMDLPAPLIEFLIPVTIVATAVENLRRVRAAEGSGHRYARRGFAAGFGLVHGAGFANYLESLFVSPIAIPLLGFNLGIELGQLAALGVIAVGFALFDAAVARLPATRRFVPFRARAVVVSAVVMVVAAGWAIERSPW